jgi:hypothetical protein
MAWSGFSPVQQCPRCTALVEGDATTCGSCGYTLEATSATDADHASAPDTPEPLAGELVPARRRIDRQSHPVSRWSLPVLGGAGVLCAAAAILAFGWLHAQTPEPSSSTQQIASSPTRPNSMIVEPPPVQKWLGRRQATWASDGSKTITFELPAREDVSVWMTRARPQLVVRCLSRTTEVFVSLGSAASVEQQTGVHTVKIEIDDDPAVVQQWTDSVSSQDLFSPDALTLTRRLADAQRMRFSYTPFNAQPVVAEFTVEGFNELAPLVAGTCGWRLDETPVYQPARSARLKQQPPTR